MTTPAEVLRRAKAMIQERGWVQGGFSIPGVGVCVSHAILANGRTWNRRVASIDLFSRANGIEGRHISQWNDDLGRTKGQVLAAFDRAIALAEEEAEG